MKTLTSIFGILVLMALAINMTACGDDCSTVDGIEVCGEIGDVVYTTQLGSWDQQVQWPPIVREDGRLLLARNNELIELSNDGALSVLVVAEGTLSPLSIDAEGSVFGVSSETAGSKVVKINPETGSIQYSDSISGDGSPTPPSLGNTVAHVNTTTGGDLAPSTIVVDPDSLSVMETNDQTSPVATTPDDTTRNLEGSPNCWEPYDALVAKDAAGNEIWRHTEPSGVLDYAPGGAGETYIVTGDRGLVKVSATGQEEWRFMPDCAECNVAAAPTVTADTIYFPVWEGWVSSDTCSGSVSPTNDAIDPLYALSLDGSLLWTYDGFDTESSRFIFGTVPVWTEDVKHHPSGRPGVAQDGTLFVATDGAVVSLDANGEETGRALYDESAGEVTSSGPFSGTWRNPGVTPAPVLGPNGILYVWDGTNVRAFNPKKPAADVPWTAPFGGYTNDGRVRR